MKTFLFGNAKSNAQIVARIGIMAALTVLVQYLTGLAGLQLLTGSFVNLFLLLSSILCGLVGGVAIGVITPFIAFFVKLNPNIVLVPFIALANALYVAAYSVICLALQARKVPNGVKYVAYSAVGFVTGAAIKYAFMYLICVKLILPLFLPAKALQTVSIAWGVLQLFTALIGGAAATAISLPLRKLSLFRPEEAEASQSVQPQATSSNENKSQEKDDDEENK